METKEERHTSIANQYAMVFYYLVIHVARGGELSAGRGRPSLTRSGSADAGVRQQETELTESGLGRRNG